MPERPGRERPPPRLATSLETAVQRLGLPTGEPIALALFDLDGYRSITEREGAGAQRHLAALRGHIETAFPGAAVLPFSRDGFAVCARLAGAAAIIAAERVRAERERESLGAALGTVSVGVAIARPKRRAEPVALVSGAMAALQRAKRDGRNRVISAEPEAMSMKSTYFARPQLERLAAIARREQRTESSLLREALEHLLSVYEE